MGKNLEVVDYFKHLGIKFNFNGTFSKWKKQLNNQSIRARYSVISKGRSLGLPIDIQVDLFDKMVLPVLTYSCEVWGIGITMC